MKMGARGKFGRSGVLALGVVAACGLAAAASAAQGADRVVVPASAVRATLEQLAVQPGDAEAFARVGEVERKWVSQPGVAELTGTVQVRPVGATMRGERLRGTASRKANLTAAQARAERRVSPLVVDRADDVGTLLVRVPDGLDENQFAAMLMATGDYEWVEPNRHVFVGSTVPNDPAFGSAWQHNRLQSTLAWDITVGSPDIVVAIVDSGIDTNHPDLEGNIVRGFDAMLDLASDEGGSIEDFHGHGTFVAGCAAAKGNNGRGAVGVGWNFKIMPIKVTDSGGADLFDLQQGARWAAENGAHVVNVSFSGVADFGWQLTGQFVKRNGAVLFHSAGNDNRELPNGEFPDVVVVASTTSSDTKSGFSNFGGLVSLTAPGSSVYSSRVGGGFGTGSGTSFSSPIAAGVGAMIFAANPALGPDDVQEVLFLSVDDLGAPGEDNIFGHGRVNTFNAVTMAQGFLPRVNLPIEESFETALDAGLWPVAAGVSVGVPPVAAPEGVSAGVFEGAATLESAVLRPKFKANDEPVIRLDLLERGVDSGEALVVEYKDASGQWVVAFEVGSNGRARETWTEYAMAYPEGADYSGVVWRVRSTGSDATDTWFVDDLAARDWDGLEAPFVEDFSVPVGMNPRFASVGSAVSSDGASNPPSGNAVLAITTDEPVETVGFAANSIDFLIGSPKVRFGWQTLGVPAGETLRLETSSNGGPWALLGAVTSTGDSPSFEVAEFGLPAFSRVSNLRLRLVAPGGGAGESWFVDEFFVGLEYPGFLDAPAGCSPADLAAPFGALTFADISAFLGAFTASDPAADLAAPFGSFTFADISAFLGAFSAGCP